MALSTGREGFLYRRNDRRNHADRKRKRTRVGGNCLHTGCTKKGRRGWAKGFCSAHALLQDPDPRKGKHRSKLPVKTAEKLKKVKKVKKLRETKSHGQQDSQAELTPSPLRWSNPYFHEKTSKNRVALKLRNAEKLKKATRKLTRKLLKPQIVSDKLLAESDAEFAWCEDLHQDSVNNPMLLLKAAAAADAAQPSRQDRTRPLIADLDCYKNYEDQAWLAHAYSTGSEEWLALARSEGLFCECCWPRSLRSSSMMGLGVWGGAGGQGPGRNQLGRPGLG